VSGLSAGEAPHVSSSLTGEVGKGFAANLSVSPVFLKAAKGAEAYMEDARTRQPWLGKRVIPSVSM
jgi:hypothetical protein